MIVKMPCVKCRPGTEDDHNVIAVDEDGDRELMICGNRPCLEKAYCILLEKKLIKKGGKDEKTVL